MRISRRELFVGSAGLALSHYVPGQSVAKPTPAQLAWQQAELGVVFHWDLHVFDGKRYSQGANQRTAIDDPQIFAPTDYDIDQWFESVTGMGARFAILTACHETGFRLWQSDANPYCMKMLNWRDGKADIVRDFVEAARRHGVKPGIYFGARWNSNLGVLSFKVTDKSPVTQEQYNRMIEQEVEELCTRYGELFEIWFDGGVATPAENGPDVLPIWEKHQPDGLFYHSNERRDARWGGSESGTVPYPCWATFDHERFETGVEPPEVRRMLGNGVEGGPDWCPAMSDAPLRGVNGRHEWFWEPDDDLAVYPVDRLMDMYERSVGHNSTLIMGLTPDARGLVPDVDTSRCVRWGRQIEKRYGHPVAESHGSWQTETGFSEPTMIDRVIIQEEIKHGHRVREYMIEGKGESKWFTLGKGTCIGHKRIQKFSEQSLTDIRLTITESTDEPRISRFAAFKA